ncbi:hypothetical protein AMTR_s00016p00098710 [Amborella trichopoda]|uniref:Uncharacterized protein n=1 Tax=Amborella trichopoda TaxID=13333 RepID=W1PET5_AMBTC|nr:hypothetical protein AMTR_s00016p00098710 [Amborella trichopoda]
MYLVKQASCVVAVVQGTKTIKTLSAMQLTKEGELTRLATLVGAPKEGDPLGIMANEVECALEGSKDRMSPKLPKRLGGGHKIERKPGAKPSAIVLDKKVPLELEEPRKATLTTPKQEYLVVACRSQGVVCDKW